MVNAKLDTHKDAEVQAEAARTFAAMVGNER